MQRELLYQTKHIDVEYDAKNGYLYCNWKGFQTVDSVKSSGERILELLKKKNCKKVLNDNRQVAGPWQGAADWAAKDWFPRMYAAGLEYFAWVVSPNIFSQLSMEQTLANNASQSTRTFGDLSSAEKWLIEMGK